MNIRPLIAITVCAGVALGGVATAGPKKKPAPVCNLVTDNKDDTFLLRYQQTGNDLGAPVPYGPHESALDITSVDVSSDAKTLTAVVRVQKLSKAASTAPGGLSFRVQFATPTQKDENIYLSGYTNGSTDTFEAGTRAITANVQTKLADATGVFDLQKNEVRISAPLATWAKQGATPGVVVSFEGLDQTASRGVAAGRAAFADVALSDKTYTLGAPSCVVPGK